MITPEQVEAWAREAGVPVFRGSVGLPSFTFQEAAERFAALAYAAGASDMQRQAVSALEHEASLWSSDQDITDFRISIARVKNLAPSAPALAPEHAVR